MRLLVLAALLAVARPAETTAPAAKGQKPAASNPVQRPAATAALRRPLMLQAPSACAIPLLQVRQGDPHDKISLPLPPRKGFPLPEVKAPLPPCDDNNR